MEEMGIDLTTVRAGYTNMFLSEVFGSTFANLGRVYFGEVLWQSGFNDELRRLAHLHINARRIRVHNLQSRIGGIQPLM